ncbi:trihelix transcription factor ASIL2-like [Momordica charantia]|uniref:Trihelix transcription factor ASIL2-like n=1 Tax=Momordica charantia TaxID=3673 RepID=A0A6J1CLW3_MOMCH|nr:trihelix transcription factor ASIL2-like [Momordica charantia]
MGRLARAIERFGKMYERVEAEKLRQMVELEKQRMQFAKDLEVERMQMFTETQVQLERIKRGKKSGSNVYSMDPP